MVCLLNSYIYGSNILNVIQLLFKLTYSKDFAKQIYNTPYLPNAISIHTSHY